MPAIESVSPPPPLSLFNDLPPWRTEVGWGLHFSDLGSHQLHMLTFKRTRVLPVIDWVPWEADSEVEISMQRSLGIATCGRKDGSRIGQRVCCSLWKMRAVPQGALPPCRAGQAVPCVCQSLREGCPGKTRACDLGPRAAHPGGGSRGPTAQGRVATLRPLREQAFGPKRGGGCHSALSAAGPFICLYWRNMASETSSRCRSRYWKPRWQRSLGEKVEPVT